LLSIPTCHPVDGPLIGRLNRTQHMKFTEVLDELSAHTIRMHQRARARERYKPDGSEILSL
jgi:hypothetical protein